MAPEGDVEEICFDAPHTTDASLQLLKFVDVMSLLKFSPVLSQCNLPGNRRSSCAVKNVHWEVLDNYSER